MGRLPRRGSVILADRTVRAPAVRHGRGLLRVLRAHWLVVVLFAAGVGFRVVTTFAYQPALLYWDSFRYLGPVGMGLQPTGIDPPGYDLFVLRPLLLFGGLRLVVVVQHVAGLGMAALIYALGARLGARRWLAALATAPVLLDGYQLQIEQLIMSDVWLELVLVLVAWVLFAGARPPTSPRVALVGGLLGAAVMLRLIAIVLVVPALVLMLVLGWRSDGFRGVAKRTGLFALCWVAAVGAYSGYYYSVTGHVGFTKTNSSVSYARAADAADCEALHLGPPLKQFCKPEPNGHPIGIDAYAHLIDNPSFKPDLPPGLSEREAMGRFARAVFVRQPLRVVEDVLDDYAKGFAWSKTTSPGDVSVARWQFQTEYPVYAHGVTKTTTEYFDAMPPTVHTGLATFLHTYQLHGGYTPGAVLGVAGLLGLVGSVVRRKRLRGHSARAPGVFLAATGFFILLASDAFEFSWRYQLPGLVLFPLAGVLGLTVMFTSSRGVNGGEKP